MRALDRLTTLDITTKPPTTKKLNTRRHECGTGSSARRSTPAPQRESAASCRIEGEPVADAQTTRRGYSVV
jgi:hypothetical protein